MVFVFFAGLLKAQKATVWEAPLSFTQTPQPETLSPVCCAFLALCGFVQLRHPTTFTFQQMVCTAGAIRLVGSSSGTSSACAGTEKQMKAA